MKIFQIFLIFVFARSVGFAQQSNMSGCMTVSTDSNQTYKAGQELIVKFALDPKFKTMDPKPDFVGWLNFTGIPNTVTQSLVYNPVSNSLEGRLRVPNQVRKGWGIEGVLRIRGQSFDQDLEFAGGREFPLPKLNVPVEEPTPPKIKVQRAVVVTPQKSNSELPVENRDSIAQVNDRAFVKIEYTVELNSRLSESKNLKNLVRVGLKTGDSTIYRSDSGSAGCHPFPSQNKKTITLHCSEMIPMHGSNDGSQTIAITAGDNYDQTEFISGRDFPLKLPVTTLKPKFETKVESLTAKAISKEKLKVTAKLASGSTGDKLEIYVSSEGSGYKDRMQYWLGTIKKCNSAGECTGELDIPSTIYGNPTKFTMQAVTRSWNGKWGGDPTEITIPRSMFPPATGASSNYDSSSSSSGQRSSLGSNCGVVSGISISSGGSASSSDGSRPQ
jgi:hypothetical protein